MVLLLLAVLAGIGFSLYVGMYYHALPQDYAATEENEDFLIYGERDSTCGFIFYPGGKVEECAYAPMLSMLAENGVCCVVARMPWHLAVFRPDAASRIMDEIPAVQHWYLGGHSLGGAMAADFAADHQEKFSGLVLLAAYPTKELKTLPVLSIYGSEDGVLNAHKYKDAITYADAVKEHVIEGGNHAGFGNYGHQKGDGDAKITSEEQWRETVSYILDFMRETGSVQDTGSMQEAGGGTEEDVYSEIPIDFPFRQMGQAYSLTLASKETQGETEEKTDREYELWLHDENGEVLQRISCGVLAEPIAFSYDGLVGWSDLELFPEGSSTGLFFSWKNERFSEKGIRIPRYSEVRGRSILTVEDQGDCRIKKLCQINVGQGCVETVRSWKLDRDTGMLEIWDHQNNRSLYSGRVDLRDGAPVNQEYYDILFYDDLYVRSERPEELNVPTWIDGPRTDADGDIGGAEGFEYVQREVFGNDGHIGEYESREALLADFGFADSTPVYQYFNGHQDLWLELYQDSDSGRFCGIVYDWHITDEKEKWAGMQGFTVNSVQREQWAGADPFSIQAVYGEEGEPIIKINYVYRDDGTLFYRDYWHDPLEYGTTLSSLDSLYDESGRVVYEKGYITHGKLEYYYIYTNEGDKPAYCLTLDHNVGCAIANIIQYD